MVLTLDIGSSSVRALLFDERAQPVAGSEARVGYHLHTTPDGGAELDPDAMLGHITACVDAALARAERRAGEIRAVALSSLAFNVVGLDVAWRPLTPVITYADTRAAPQAEALRARLDPEQVHERTGCPLHPAYLPAQLLRLREEAPALYAGVRRWATLDEYVYGRLFGTETARMELSLASWSGLLNRHSLDWDAELLAALDLDPASLGPAGDVHAGSSGLAPEFAARWPSLRSVPWYPAVADGAAANLGSGCASPDRLALTIGTSAAARLALPACPSRLPPALWCYRIDRARALLGGALSEGGNVYDWLMHTLGVGDPAALEAEVAVMAPAAHGLTMLPLIAGERSPGWHAAAHATIAGLRLDTGPADLVRAGLEAVAYRLAVLVDALEASAGPIPEAVGSGGALLASPAWLQILADVLGRHVTASAETEATARGAALLALESLGVIPDAGALPAAQGRGYEPDARRHGVYQEARARQEALYRALIG